MRDVVGPEAKPAATGDSRTMTIRPELSERPRRHGLTRIMRKWRRCPKSPSRCRLTNR